MSKESAIRDRIKEMAKLTIFSGKINEIQEKNLKTFPFVFFNNVKSVKIEYDLSRKVKESGKAEPITNELKQEHRVTYHLTLVEEDYTSSEVNLDKRFSCLEEAVRNLFWKDIKVQVFFNNKIAYESTM